MPNRILRDSILDSETVNSWDEEDELFYRRLMSIVDDEGRFEDRPKLIQARAFLMRIDDWPLERIEKCLSAVSQPTVIRLTDDRRPTVDRPSSDRHTTVVRPSPVSRYEVDGRKYIQINKFNQRVRHPKYPAPPQNDLAIPQNDRRPTVGRLTDDRRTTDDRPSDDRRPTAQAKPKAKTEASPPSGMNPEWEERFETWWETLPRKAGKDKARIRFRIAIIEGNHNTPEMKSTLRSLGDADARYRRLMESQPSWNAEWAKASEPHFIPHPASHLNGLNWVTPLSAPAPVVKPERMSWMDDEFYAELCAKGASQ